MLDGFGLINMNGRMYDPVIGRVLSPDPSVQSPTYTQNYNRYSYCLNNPLRYTDPSGYFVHPTDWRDEPVILAPEFGPGCTGPLGIRGSSGSFLEQLESSIRYLPDGFYDLTSLDNKKGTYTFNWEYNSAGTEYYNTLADIANKQRANCQAQEAQNGYDNNLVAGPGGTPSTDKTRLEAMNEALAAFGTATSGVESFTGANASSRIVYYTLDGTKAWISTEKVLGLLRSAGIYAIGLGTAVDITLSLSGEQSWGKTGLNTAIGVIALSIGTGPGIVLGVGYLVLDKMGAFDIPKNIPSYIPPFNEPDATNARPIYIPLPH
jgi:RHS repeat-associated protein